MESPRSPRDPPCYSSWGIVNKNKNKITDSFEVELKEEAVRKAGTTNGGDSLLMEGSSGSAPERFFFLICSLFPSIPLPDGLPQIEINDQRRLKRHSLWEQSEAVHTLV